MQYITVGEFWEIALPPDTMFGETGYRAGTVTPGAHTGTSTGLVAYTFSPRDYFNITLTCKRAGSVNRLNLDNPTGLPVFQVSQFSRVLLGGQVSGSYILPKAPGSIEIVDPLIINLATYVTVVGSAIQVFVRRDDKQLLATDAEIRLAIQAEPLAMALIQDISLNPNTDGKKISPALGPIDFGPDFTSPLIRVTPDQDMAYVDIAENGLRFSFENNGPIQGLAVSLGSGNAGVTYTANQSQITVKHINPGLLTAATTVSVNGTAINVTLAHDGTNPIATADQVRIAVSGNSLAMLLLSAVANTGSGAGIAVATSAISLPLIPAFALNDTWVYTTAPSKELVKMIQAACDYCDQYVSGTYDLLLLGWGEDFKMVVAHFAKWFYILRKGLDSKQEFKVYEPKWAMQWLKDAQGGAFQKGQKLIETGPGTYFAELVLPKDVLAGDFPI